MKVKPVVLIALVAAALTLIPVARAYASCALVPEKLTSVTQVVEEEVARLAPLKPGSDPRDATWLKDNVVAMVPEWLPKARELVTRAKPAIDRIVDDCYRPGDYAAAGPVRFDFIACAKKAALAQVASAHPAEWGAICDEVTTSLENRGFEELIRAWTRSWVDAYIQYVQTRPVA